jgi:Fe-S-cluster-containing hydrogenase component 2
VCPFEAITIANNLAYIDYEKCKLCRKCEDECPQHSIVAVNFPARKPKPAPVADAPKTEAPKADAPKAEA